MAMEMIKETFEEKFEHMELIKMKNELTMFVAKMKSEGFLSSVDYRDIPDLHEFEKAEW